VAKRLSKKAPAKRAKPADDIATTPEYQAMLKDISALIEAAKKQGAFGSRRTKRDQPKKARGKGEG
jgi:hypothetical protein